MVNLEDSRILITGGNGFIGRHLANEITRRYNVEKLSLCDINPISDSGSILNPNPKFCYQRIDLTRTNKVEKMMKKLSPTHIFHLAASTDVNRSFSSLKKSIKININGTCNVLHSIRNENPEVFIHMGTSEIYGNNEVPFNEEMPIDPHSPYSASKASSEIFTRLLSTTYDIPSVYIRSFNVFGEDQSNRMLIPEVIIGCLKNEDIQLTKGEQTRESNYVGDISRGIVEAGIRKEAVGEIINLGSGDELTVKQLVIKIKNLAQSSSNLQFGALDYRPNEVWRMCCDNRKAKEILDWEPKVELEKGLLKTIKWYKSKTAIK